MGETLNVYSAELNRVGTQITDVAGNVRQTYKEMQDIVEQVTSKDSWRGAASEAFLDKFESIRPTFEQDLQQLEDLGPALIGAANNYSEAEDNNVAGVREGGMF